MVWNWSRRNCLRMWPGASFFQLMLLKGTGVPPGISSCCSFTVGEHYAPGLPLPAELCAVRTAQKRNRSPAFTAGFVRLLWGAPSEGLPCTPPAPGTAVTAPLPSACSPASPFETPSFLRACDYRLCIWCMARCPACRGHWSLNSHSVNVWDLEKVTLSESSFSNVTLEADLEEGDPAGARLASVLWPLCWQSGF